jgi:8-oxo-dGTP diphosphatase
MAKYNFQARIWVKKSDDFVLSEGRVKLLKLVNKYGSIKKAAEEMEMSYRHAWGIINKINESLGETAVESERGGSSGGRTVVTRVGLDLISAYEERMKATDVIMKFGPRPAITVDGIIEKDRKVLLVKRKNPPFKGSFAIPGGFVEFKEPVEEAVLREIQEETGLKTKIAGFIGVYSAPDRDPRGHTISVVYELKITGGKVRAGSDAQDLQWFKVKDLPELAFDHNDIMNDYLKRKKK